MGAKQSEFVENMMSTKNELKSLSNFRLIMKTSIFVSYPDGVSLNSITEETAFLFRPLIHDFLTLDTTNHELSCYYN